jgi:hypothetical protein
MARIGVWEGPDDNTFGAVDDVGWPSLAGSRALRLGLTISLISCHRVALTSKLHFIL